MEEINNTTNVVESKTDKMISEHTYYSTNDKEKEKNVNTGKYAYVSKNKIYELYNIIDFDDSCIYFFTYGNGEDNYCESIKIRSGDLNNGIEVKYKNKENAWITAVHFKYVNQPYTLVIVDNGRFDYKFSATSIDDALKLMKK